MRLRYKAGLGLCAGLGLVLACRAASAEELDDESGPAAVDEEQPAAAPDEQQSTTAPEQTGEQPPSAAPMPYTLAPLTGEPGLGWSPIIGAPPMMGGAPMMGVQQRGLYGPGMMQRSPGAGQTCCACCGAPQGAAALGPGVIPSPRGAPRAFGAGVAGPAFEGAQPFGIGPIYSGFGAWSPRLGVGPRAYGKVIGGQ